MTLSVKADGGEWKDVATVTEDFLGDDYKIGFGAWETHDRSKTVTFSDVKIGTSTDDFATLEASESVSFFKESNINIDEIEKNPVIDTTSFKSNHARLEGIAIETLGFEKIAVADTVLDDYYHITSKEKEVTLSVTKDSESDNVQALYGDYRTKLELTEDGSTYTTAEPVVLRDGLNTLYVRVYAEDGITYKQHILAVTYTPDYVEKEITDGLLKEFIFDGKDITDEIFIVGSSIKKSVINDTVQLKVTAKEGAMVTFGMEGEALPEAVTSVMEGEVRLRQGEQRVKIVITSAEEEKTYYLNVEKSSYLSDYEWISATVGYGDGVNKDVNHNGSTICLADEEGRPVEFEKGLGVHATSVIKYDITDIEYDKLQGYVGIDYCQYEAEYGDVRFTVIIDGVQVYDSGIMTKTTSMKKIDIAIPEGAKLLELHASEGANNWNDHANWADLKFVNAYTVTFDADGGSAVTAQSVEKGFSATKPADPTKDGYTFIGWYLGNQEYNFETPVTQDITLIAKWDIVPEVVDKAELQSVYEIHKDKEQGNYTDESYAAFTSALETAITVLEKEGATQEEVDVALAALEASITGLTEKAPEEPESKTGIWVEGFDTEVDYTGAKQTFENLKVYDGETELTLGKDYTVSYKNNQNAYIYEETDTANFNAKKAPQVILKMKGDYTGTKTLYFTISPIDLDDASVSANDIFVTYTGKKQTPAPEVTWNGKKLTSKDYTVKEYDAAKKDKKAFLGEETTTTTYGLTIEGKGNFAGEKHIALTIGKKGAELAISKMKVTGVPKKTEWKKEAAATGITLTDFKVMNGRTELKENTDYTVTYENNDVVGTATLVLTGTGTANAEGISYHGEKRINFAITGTSLSGIVVNNLPKAGYPYTGDEIQPLELKDENGNALITVTMKKNGPEVDSDVYEVRYEKNKDKGTASMIFTGKADQGYTGTKKVTFKIAAASLTEGYSLNVAEEAVYTAGGTTPEVTVTDASGEELKAGVDYTVSYKNNKAVTTETTKKKPVAVVKGKGNYAGTLEKEFVITKQKVVETQAELLVVAKDKVESTKKNGWKQSFKVMDVNGKALTGKDYDAKNAKYYLVATEGEDVELTSISQVPAGSKVKVVVKLQGASYEGTVTGTYRILKAGHDISKAKITLVEQKYTGSEIYIDGNEDIKSATLKVDKKTSLTLKFKEEGDPDVAPEGYGYVEVVEESYEKNVNKGTAKVTLKGAGELGGEKTVTFKIGTRNVVDNWFEELMK